MKISLIHPSRSRPDMAYEVYQEWISKANGSVEYILSIDTTDIKRNEYESKFVDVKTIVNNNKNLIEAANKGAKEATGDILILVSDDFHCPVGWDDIVKEATQGSSNWLLKTWDGFQPWIVTLPIMDREFYESLGYIYFPGYMHLFCDTDLTHIADITGRLIIRNDITFTHSNETYKGGAGDHINQKAFRTWSQGERLYRLRVRQRFGIKTKVDVHAIAEEGRGHLRWLTYGRKGR